MLIVYKFEVYASDSLVYASDSLVTNLIILRSNHSHHIYSLNSRHARSPFICRFKCRFVELCSQCGRLLRNAENDYQAAAGRRGHSARAGAVL